MARTITITSGKGGVGKTNLSANLAVQLAAQGKRPCIFDADLGLANINILFGLYPEKTIEDVILDEAPLEQVIIKNCHGIDIIPGSSGVEKIANSEPQQIERLITAFAALNAYDFLFFDTSAGVSRNVVSFCLASAEIILVITPEPTSLTDAYALLKILCANGMKSAVRVVVNHCKDTAVARQTYGRFKEVTKKYLAIDLQPLGFIVADSKISFAVKRQQPFITLYPDAIASKCIKAIAQNLIQQQQDAFAPPTVESFWQQFISRFTGQLNLRGEQDDKKKAVPLHKPQPVSEQQQPEPLVRDTTIPAPSADAGPVIGAVETAAGAARPEPPQPVEALSEKKPENSAAEPPAPVPALASGEPAPADETVSSPAAAPDEKSPRQTGPCTALPFDQNYYTLLHTLVGSVAAISEDFKNLRKAFEGNGRLAPTPAQESPSPALQEQQPIVLDFERYMRRRDRNQ